LPDEAEIVIEPYKKIVIHEIIENKFNDLVAMIVSGTRAAGGTTIPMLFWCNGVVFQIVPFDPHSEQVIGEQLKGTVHYAAVTFATKQKFEPEVRLPDGTVRLIDQRANPNFMKLAEVLKSRAQYQS
jgi:hypothetical protein